MPQISQGVTGVRSTALQLTKLWADFQGKGAAAPIAAAVTVLGARDNYASTREGNAVGIVRGATGVYTLTMPTAPPSAAKVMEVIPVARGTTAGIYATLVSWAVTSGRLVVVVNTWVGTVATDLADGVDFLRLSIEADLSNA